MWKYYANISGKATGTVGQKKGREDDGHGIEDKRPRMESVGSDVSVSSKPKKLHPKVAISTSASPAVQVRCIMFFVCTSTCDSVLCGLKQVQMLTVDSTLRIDSDVFLMWYVLYWWNWMDTATQD